MNFMGKNRPDYLKRLDNFDACILSDQPKEDPKESIYRSLDMIEKTGIQPEHGKALASKLRYLLKMYDEETRRLKSDIAQDGNVTIIDASNKGRLAEHESMVEDLLLLLDESFRD